MKLTDRIPVLDLDSATPPTNKRLTVLYGEIGKRKTTTACSMVKENGLLISADNSWIVLKRDVHKELRKKVKLIHYDSASQLLHIDYKPYDTVVLDTGTAMVDRYLDLLLKKARWTKGDGYRERLSPIDSRDKNNPDLVDLTDLAPADYKVTRDKFRPIFHYLAHEVDAHIIITCHINEPGPLSRSPVRMPRMPTATWKALGELANIIGVIEGNDGRGFTVNVDESSAAFVLKSQIDGISGRMPLATFVERYREGI